MKTFGVQVLILGGLYFIISNLLSLGTGIAFEVCNVAALSIFTLLLAFLCFKKKYVFLSRLQDKFKKTSVYIAALGVAQYFGVVFAGITAVSRLPYLLHIYRLLVLPIGRFCFSHCSSPLITILEGNNFYLLDYTKPRV